MERARPSTEFHSLNYRKNADEYLGALAYCFNRRFDLRGIVERIFVDS